MSHRSTISGPPKSTFLLHFFCAPQGAREAKMSTFLLFTAKVLSPIDDIGQVFMIGLILVLPHVLAASLSLLALRNRWFEGSWNRWMKHSAVSYCVAYFGWVMGAAFSVFFQLHFPSWGILVITTSLVFLAVYVALLKARHPWAWRY